MLSALIYGAALTQNKQSAEKFTNDIALNMLAICATESDRSRIVHEMCCVIIQHECWDASAALLTTPRLNAIDLKVGTLANRYLLTKCVNKLRFMHFR